MIRKFNGSAYPQLPVTYRVFAASAAFAALAFSACSNGVSVDEIGNEQLQRESSATPGISPVQLREALGLHTDAIAPAPSPSSSPASSAVPSPDSLTLNPISSAVLRPENTNTATNIGLRPDAPATTIPSRPEIVRFTLDDNNTIVSFNCKLGHAEWVAWTVSAGDIGNTKRSKDFHPEPRLPNSNCISPQPSDIGVSGYDRGHMAPSGDRTSSREANDAVFSMANIVPQAPQVNQKGWNDLEMLTRDLVRSGKKSAIVYSGTFGSLGTIRGSGINIPAVTWKVVVVIPSGASSANEDTETIAIWYPNELHAAPLPLSKALVSIDEIEARTKIDFLSGIADDLENQIEQKQTTLPQ
jgi:endonuclease G